MGERRESRHFIRPDRDTALECPKDSRVEVTNPTSQYFGVEGQVVELGKHNKFTRKVKLDGIPGFHVFILRELKQV